MLDQSINASVQRSYSLYVLPLVGILTMISLSIGVRLHASNENFLVSFWQFGIVENLLMISSIVLKMGIKFAIILMCAYHFRINIASLKNMLITVVMVIICELLTSAVSLLFYQSLSGFDTLFFIYMAVGVVNLLIQCAVYTLCFILVYQYGGSVFDTFKGAVQKTPHYWRIANLITLFFMIHLMTSVMMSLYLVMGFNAIALGNLGVILLINSFILLPLVALSFSKKMSLQRLEIGEILRTGRFLGFWIVILLVAFELLMNYLDSAILMGGFVVLGLTYFVLYILFIVLITFFTVKNRFSK